MAPGTALAQPQKPQNAVLVDVTSLIGAQEFILTQNNRRALVDPFGRQCFVEIIQSLIFMSRRFASRMTYEEQATVITEWEMRVIPGLLQTRGYAEAIRAVRSAPQSPGTS